MFCPERKVNRNLQSLCHANCVPILQIQIADIPKLNECPARKPRISLFRFSYGEDYIALVRSGLADLNTRTGKACQEDQGCVHDSPRYGLPDVTGTQTGQSPKRAYVNQEYNGSMTWENKVVPRDGFEPPTLRFSVACSTN